MKRLVIKHGEQILRHELATAPVVVGREVGCDLTFDDPSLSRRHGSFEATSEGARFVDLGSRNGSWVNFKKTKEADLKPGDTVRIGALLITYQEDAPEPPPPSPEEIGDDTATVIVTPETLKPAPPPTARKPAETPRLEVPAREPNVPAAPEPPVEPVRPASVEKTVLLDRKAAAPVEAAGTRILRRDAHVAEKKSSSGAKAPLDTARLPQEAFAPQPVVPPVARPATEPSPEAEPEETTGAAWSWTAKHGLLVLGVALVVYLVLALPLVRTLGNALREESLRRGRVLLDLLAATNGPAMADGRARDLDVELVTREERVKEALLLSLDGKVLAPSSRVDETLTAIDGIQQEVGAIRTFYLGRRTNGDYVMVEPVLDRGLRVGLAVVVYEVATASGSWAVAVLFLGFLVLLLGVLVALVLGKRFTLLPLQALTDDIEAVVKGDAARLPTTQAFSELSIVARSVNRLIERLGAPLPAAGRGYPTVDLQPTDEGLSVPEAPKSVSVRAEPRSPSPPPVPEETGDGGRFWADASFIVARVDPEAAAIMDALPEALEGHHVIEAIKDQKLLGIVLDALNSLDSGSPAPLVVELAEGPISVTAVREGEWVVVSLKRAR